jgi:hypothetical protein
MEEFHGGGTKDCSSACCNAATAAAAAAAAATAAAASPPTPTDGAASPFADKRYQERLDGSRFDHQRLPHCVAALFDKGPEPRENAATAAPDTRCGSRTA